MLTGLKGWGEQSGRVDEPGNRIESRVWMITGRKGWLLKTRWTGRGKPSTQGRSIFMFSGINELKELIQEHTEWRGKCLNMIASENLVSKTVRWYLTSDFGHRYNTFYDDPMQRNYKGNKYIALVETKAREAAQRLFGCRFAELRPLGGEMAVDAVIIGLTKPGDVVFETGDGYGGQQVCTKLVSAGLLEKALKVEWIIYDPNTGDFDIEAMARKIRETRPKLIICGKAQPLFPESIGKLRPVADEVGAYIAYDASHVMGLIAGKAFFNPLDHGVDVMMGSTHKTFPGPQGGIILSNNEAVFRKIRMGLYPPLVTNHHANRVAALAASFLEMLEFGEAYHSQIVRNSQALGKALHDFGFDVLYPEMTFSHSHQVLVDVAKFGGGDKMASLLESANIMVSGCTIATDMVRGTKRMGIRIGTQEVTRVGMKEKDMGEIATLFRRLIMDGEDPGVVARDVATFTSQFNRIHFTWDGDTPAYDLVTSF